MNNSERIKTINIENFVFIIYYIIITLSIISNNVEKQFLIYGNEEDKQKYRNLLFIIFGVVFLIYLYYTFTAYQDAKNTCDPEIKKLAELSLLASVLVLISGAIYLYIIYKDEDINVELVFS